MVFPSRTLRQFSFFRKELFPCQTFSAISKAFLPVIRIILIAPPGAVHREAAVSSKVLIFFEKIPIIFYLFLEKNPLEIIIIIDKISTKKEKSKKKPVKRLKNA
jgi:hypothetical protein